MAAATVNEMRARRGEDPITQVCKHCEQSIGDHVAGGGCEPAHLAKVRQPTSVYEWIRDNVETFFNEWNKCPDFIRLKPEVHNDLMIEMEQLRVIAVADPLNPDAYNEVKLNFGVGSVKVVMDPNIGVVSGKLVKLFDGDSSVEETVSAMTEYVRPEPKGKTLAEVLAEEGPVESLTNRAFAHRFQSEKDK